MPFGKNRFTTAKAESIVAALIDKIEWLMSQRRNAGGGYREITLVGHSFGAVLARKIAIVAHGEQTDEYGDVRAPFEPEFDRFRERRDWAGTIRRIVLLAGLNRVIRRMP